MTGYADSADEQAMKTSREKALFADASRLWWSLMDVGGFSYRPDWLGSRLPDQGYFVSDGKHELKLKTVTVEIVYNYLVSVVEKLIDPNLFIGGWIDDDGIVYLDVSFHFDYIYEAVTAGGWANQKAIWDIKNQHAIPL